MAGSVTWWGVAIIWVVIFGAIMGSVSAQPQTPPKEQLEATTQLQFCEAGRAQAERLAAQNIVALQKALQEAQAELAKLKTPAPAPAPAPTLPPRDEKKEKK
jgi:hypothetical protein